jgi:hypothetical protein
MSGRIPFSERNTPWRGVLDLTTGCYPAFLFGGGVGRWLPVFHFHEAIPERLEPYLSYLAENGYRTVTSEAIAALVRRGVHPGPKSVALCFDDAWASLWTVAAPLLRKHGLQAITYVSPARVPELAVPRPTLETSAGAPAGVDDSETPFAAWCELQKLHGSGTVDIQAHTLRHTMVFADDVIGGFVQPGFTRHPHLYPLLDTGSGERYLTPADLGAPLYTQRSRYSTALRYDNPGAFEACTRHVRENGGVEYFKRPDWEQGLRKLAGACTGRQETPAQRDAAMLEDLATAREQLNSKLGTDTVRHMCFPWAIASKPGEIAAEKAGYETAFGDRLFGGRSVKAGDPPYRLMRLKHQHLYCLPGKGLFIRRIGLIGRIS